MGNPYNCHLCPRMFNRSEHLQRHIKIHTGEKPYHCACGERFARSDVLSHHIRTCHMGLRDQEIRGWHTRNKQIRTRRACDQCAFAKSKCDHQEPCRRCFARSLNCTYVRRQHGQFNSMIALQREETLTPQNTAGVSPGIADSDNDHRHAIRVPSIDTGSIGYPKAPDQHEAGLQLQHLDSVLTFDDAPQSDPPSAFLPWFPGPRVGADCASLEFDTILEQYPNFGLSPATPVFINEITTDQLMALGPDSAGIEERQPISPIGLSLEQTDPVEAKCQELRQLIRTVDSFIADEMVLSFVSRDNMLKLCRAYGEHFQRHYPIIHMQTFKLVEANPTLLLAVMLGGACGGSERLPSSYVVRLATQVLFLVEYEIQVGIVPLPIIQASLIARGILSLCRSDDVSKANCPHFQDTISLARRAHVFEEITLQPYKTLTRETFDWKLWILRESRKRVACAIFCQTSVENISQGVAPVFSISEFDVELPGYETCWEAKTAPECLERLKALPQQIRLPAAMRKLREGSSPQTACFEASGFGMFVLVLGLHCLLYHTAQCDPALQSDESVLSQDNATNAQDLDVAGLFISLQRELSGTNVTLFANDLVSVHHSTVLKHVNHALEAWLVTWEQRCYRERGHEDATFINDPLPLWWLAKLHMILYSCASLIPRESEFAAWRVTWQHSEGQKSQIKHKTRKWLVEFRDGLAEPHSSSRLNLLNLFESSNNCAR